MYSLAIARGPLVMEDQPCLAACAQDERLILIAGDCPPRERLRVLLRELMRAWTFETGKPADDGAWLDLAATMTQAALTDLNCQGGELGLMGLRTGESPQPGAARAGLSTNRYCAMCQSTIAGGSVIWRPGDLSGQVELRIYCEFCGHTQIWQEGQSARGLPNAICIGEPRFERGDVSGAELQLVQVQETS